MPILNHPSHFEDLLIRILQEEVKPAITKTKNPKLTPQSRKALDHPVVTTDTGDDIESKPWKYREMYIPTVLRWVLQRIQYLDVNYSLLSAKIASSLTL